MSAVLLVDDHEVESAGRTALLTRLGHDVEARSWSDLVDQRAPLAADLVLLVVRRDKRAWDRYRAVAAIGDLRDRVAPDTRIVAVMADAGSRRPAIALRLCAAGATERVVTEELASAASLAALVADPAPACRPDDVELRELRLDRTSNPAAVVALIERLAAAEPAFHRAFHHGLAQNQSGLSRRRSHTLRVKVCRLGALAANPARSAGGPARDTSLARWHEVVAFVNRCRGWELDDEVLGFPGLAVSAGDGRREAVA